METWFIIIVSLCIAALLKSTFTAISSLWSSNTAADSTQKLPPGPPAIPLIGNLFWLSIPISELEFFLRRLKTRYGPLIATKIGPRRLIFIADHSLAHHTLVQNGAVFSDRPGRPTTSGIVDSAQKAISSAAYGPTWRLLRRNLTQEILNPIRIKSHSDSRCRVLSDLVNRILKTEDHTVRLIDHLQYAMFHLLVLMCFGDGLGEEQIKEIEAVQRRLLLGFRRFSALIILPPRLSKIIFRSRWQELIQLLQDQENVLLPLIRARIQAKRHKLDVSDKLVVAYVDTFTNLQLPEENNRNLHDSEMVSLCGEFFNAGTDTTSTTLQWIMANLIKYPQLQAKLYHEIISIAGLPPPVSDGQHLVSIVEEELRKMPYLKAVVLEGLRRHPPGHFVLPHKVKQDVDLDGYLVPKNAIVNFMVADMGWDPKVWEDPMEFRPERFFDHDVWEFDITGSKEIKMMPFGAGRRICPAYELAMLHLEYFVANLIWYFEWTPLQGDEIDLTEKQEFTTVMKNPLWACVSPRIY